MRRRIARGPRQLGPASAGSAHAEAIAKQFFAVAWSRSRFIICGNSVREIFPSRKSFAHRVAAQRAIISPMQAFDVRQLRERARPARDSSCDSRLGGVVTLEQRQQNEFV
jgi:hypothetical protein